MSLNTITRIVYGLFGILYVLVGAWSMLLPPGWLLEGLADHFLAGEVPSLFLGHLLQGSGTIVLALGFVFLWFAKRKEPSRGFHWAMTFCFALDSLIHAVGAEGFIGSWPRGIANAVPFVVMLLIGLLQRREAPRRRPGRG